MKRGGYLLVLGAVAFAASVAHAQTTTTDTQYPIQEMNFDLWCQEQQHLDADRCDQRLPEDEQAFENYRATIEKYEIPYLKERNRVQDFNRNILHNDPVDHPTEPSTPPIQPINSAPPR